MQTCQLLGTTLREGLSQDIFWHSIASYHASLPAIVDEGVMAVSYYTNESSALSPFTAPDISSQRPEELLLPFTSLSIKPPKIIKQFPNYFEQFNTMSTAYQGWHCSTRRQAST